MTRRFTRHAFAATLGVALAAAIVAPAQAAKDRLVVDLVNEPSSLDPQVQWNPDSYYVYRNVFDNLLTRDDAGAIVPQIATKWSYASDTEIDFDLRSDVVFHDGKPLTADDVVFSVRRITDPAFSSPQLGQFNKIVSATAVSPTRVRLKTDGPYPALLAQLVKLSIVPRHVVEAVGKEAFNLKPIGSGPYRFEGWQRGVQVTLARNDGYWGTKGPFAAVAFRAVPDAATRVADLRAGAADLAVSLDGDLAAQLADSPRAKVLTALTERVAYLRLNPARAPFDRLEVRQAVAYAIDKQAFVDGLLGGFDKPVAQLATPAVFGWVDGISGFGFDPAKAKALIAAAGPAAKTEIVLATAPVFDQRIVQAVQQSLTEVGLVVRIEMSDMATYLKRVQSALDVSPTLSFGRWSCACQDADGIAFPLLHASSSWSAYRNPTVDGLLETARSTLDPQKRLEAYGRIHRIVADEVPVLPLYQSAVIYGAAKSLGWQPTANESLFVNRMTWKD